MTLNPRVLLLAVLLASPALASTPALHLLHFEDATPSTMSLIAPEAAALPYSLHVAAPKLDFTRADLPSHVPLPLPAMPDEGGGAGATVSSDTTAILAILLSLLIGFGTGHLIVHDREGFILFLIVDVVIVAVASVFYFGPFGIWWLGGLGGIAWLVSHVIQTLDVYGKAFGTKLLDRARGTNLVIDAPRAGPDLMLPGGSQRVLAWSF